MMNNKYSTSQALNYSRTLAKQLSDTFFQGKNHVSGPELMQVTPIKQVNLLVVKELLGRWQKEASRLRSPYFDFEAEPVKVSLSQFMNVLSQHIRIEKADFEPLLEHSISNTLQLAIDPEAFFEDEFLQKDEQIKPDDLRANLRYLDSSRAFFTDFVNELHQPADRSYLKQRFKLYLNARYKDLPQAEKQIAELDKLHPLKIEDLQEKPQSAASPGSKPFANPPQPAKTETSQVPDASLTATVNQPPAPAPAQQTIPNPAPAVMAPVAQAQPSPAPQPAPVQVEALKSVAQPPLTAQATTAKQLNPVSAGTSLSERLKQEHVSLNEKMAKPQAPTFADKMGGNKIESLKNSISINQRFAFINELFAGDNQAYHAAINELDQQPDLESAMSFVSEHLAKKYSWTNHAEHVNKLLRLVERKFA